MTTLPARIAITEVGPRDGLQNEKAIVPVEAKAAFIDALSSAGVREIEASSFVSPKWVPQLADAAEVFARIDRASGVIYSALVPNEQGLDRALAAKAGKVAVFAAASETFSQRNTNATITETIERFHPVVAKAKAARVPVRAYVSCAVACPFEGDIAPAKVRDVAARLLDLGVDEIDLGDTIGVASPADIDRLYDGLHSILLPSDTVLHLHDTRGGALACAFRAMQLGVWKFDASCGGLGGCPYAPGAAGNLATEDLVWMSRRMNIATGIDLSALLAAARQMEIALKRPLTSRVFLAERGAGASEGASAACITRVSAKA